MKAGPLIGVLLLEADHAVETLDWDDPSEWTPPVGLGAGFFGHPAFWAQRTVFAIAAGATGTTSALGTPEAVEGVVDAIRRLDGRCDLIVGGCGYFGDAWPLLTPPPSTPTYLSALDLLEDVLRSTSRDIVVMSASTAAGERAIAGHPAAERVRVVGIDGLDDWAHFARTDWAIEALVTDAGIERGLRTVLEAESGPGGKLDQVGAVVLECTVLPHYRRVFRDYTNAPVVDIADVVKGMLA